MRALKAELARNGAALSAARRAAAGRLRAAVEGCLGDLAMPGARFDVRVGWEPYAKVSAHARHAPPCHAQQFQCCLAVGLWQQLVLGGALPQTAAWC